MRLLPYYQEARRTGDHVGRESCATCREKLDVNSRQDIGCVYEAPTAAKGRGSVLRWPGGAPSLPWRDTLGKSVAPTACPLYLGRIAEASDVHAARPHFRRGTLAAWLGRAPNASLLELLEEAEYGRQEFTHDEHKPKDVT